MHLEPEQLDIQRLGECRIDSPIKGIHFLENGDRVLVSSSLDTVNGLIAQGGRLPAFEKAGPRSKIYFDPSKLKCGIVTCGGLCPGLNDVIRALVLSLYHNYKVKTVFGFPYGYEGLSYRFGHFPMELNPETVSRIHEYGGTILGSSRGHQDISEMVDTLDRMNIGVLFAIGGDGTLRGAQGIAEEIQRRGLKISVIGIPKTIDNDISYVERSFGFQTAVSEAVRAIDAAHTEAKGARNGIGLVKLMGRDSGFIAVFASA
jgi:6-phosphofructokinase 1